MRIVSAAAGAACPRAGASGVPPRSSRPRGTRRVVPGVGRTQHFSRSRVAGYIDVHTNDARVHEILHPVATGERRATRADYNPHLSEYSRLMDRTDAPVPADAPASFEQAQAELDELVRAMESGQLPLDGLLVAYRRGAQLLEFCRAKLDAVEEQVKVLEEGQLKPWTRP